MTVNNGQYSFTWKIENFSLCVLDEKSNLLSPSFRAENLGGSEWRLNLCSMRKTENEFISCYLVRIDGEEEITFKMETFDGNDGLLRSLESENVSVGELGLGWENYLAAEKLIPKCWKKDVLTIHCLIKSFSKSTTFQMNASEAWTKIGVDRCYFEWKVALSDSSDLNNCKHIFIGEKNKFELTLTVPNDDIEINIRRLDEDSSNYKAVSCKISLMNLECFQVESKFVGHFFNKNEMGAGDNWKLPNFLSKKTLLSRADELMEDDTFTLKFEISASSGEFLNEYKVKYEIPSSSKIPFLNNSLKALHGDLRNMLVSKKYSDIKLRVENQIIPSHKLMLGSRSPVFSAMFDKDMLENQTGIVDIEDIDSKTLNLFLEYIYTGSVVELEVESAMKLLVASDKYQVSSLIKECFFFLKPRLSVENVCKIFTIADMIQHKHLKSFALGYIQEHSARVLSSKVWCDWMKGNVELANEILYKLASEISK